VRCTPRLDDHREAVTFAAIPAQANAWRGSACLLFHRHDERLEHQHQLLIRGHLVQEDQVLTLQPSAFVTATNNEHDDRMPHAGAPLQLLRFMLLGRRQAGVYLRRRQTPWPAIDFAPMLRVLRELRSQPGGNSR
jgi:hypothetical protein